MEDKIEFKNGYFMAPNDIFDLDLKIHEKMVYLYLCRCGNNSTAFPSYTEIGKNCSMSRRKAIDCVAKLKEDGLLEKPYRSKEAKLIDSLSPEQKRVAEKTPQHKKKGGYVYFILADNGLIKIGKTTDLNRRLDHFTSKLPYELTLVHIIITNDHTGLEEEIHEKYKHLRRRGEWFELSEDNMMEIINKYGERHVITPH